MCSLNIHVYSCCSMKHIKLRKLQIKRLLNPETTLRSLSLFLALEIKKKVSGTKKEEKATKRTDGRTLRKIPREEQKMYIDTIEKIN